MKKPLVNESMYVGWDGKHYETVCVLIDQDGISNDDILEEMVPALCEVGLIVSGDTCSVTRTGNTIIIGKTSNRYIELDTEGKVH
jgi:hypothetical protein